MANDYDAEDLAGRTFIISMVGIALFIAAVFIFVL
jgi:hypothetical protein